MIPKLAKWCLAGVALLAVGFGAMFSLSNDVPRPSQQPLVSEAIAVSPGASNPQEWEAVPSAAPEAPRSAQGFRPDLRFVPGREGRSEDASQDPTSPVEPALDDPRRQEEDLARFFEKQNGSFKAFEPSAIDRMENNRDLNPDGIELSEAERSALRSQLRAKWSELMPLHSVYSNACARAREDKTAREDWTVNESRTNSLRPENRYQDVSGTGFGTGEGVPLHLRGLNVTIRVNPGDYEDVDAARTAFFEAHDDYFRTIRGFFGSIRQ